MGYEREQSNLQGKGVNYLLYKWHLLLGATREAAGRGSKMVWEEIISRLMKADTAGWRCWRSLALMRSARNRMISQKGTAFSVGAGEKVEIPNLGGNDALLMS